MINRDVLNLMQRSPLGHQVREWHQRVAVGDLPELDPDSTGGRGQSAVGRPDQTFPPNLGAPMWLRHYWSNA